MKKTKVTALILTIALAASVFTGCGDATSVEKVSVGMAEKNAGAVAEAVKAHDVEITPKEEIPATDTDADVADTVKEAKTEDKAAKKPDMGKETKTEDKDAKKPDATKEKTTAPTQEKAKDPTPTQGKITPAPAMETLDNTMTEVLANTDTFVQTATKPAKTESQPKEDSKPAMEPVHEHSWKAHTATKQEWVPNAVTVNDYETEKVLVGVDYRCECGAQFSSKDDFRSHKEIHFAEGKDSVAFAGGEIYEDRQVLVGSHEEDHGYYKDVTYTDYEYCDCGETRNHVQ